MNGVISYSFTLPTDLIGGEYLVGIEGYFYNVHYRKFAILDYKQPQLYISAEFD